MSVGNLALSSGASWGENYLNLGSSAYALGGVFEAGSDGSFTASICLTLGNSVSAQPIMCQGRNTTDMSTCDFAIIVYGSSYQIRGRYPNSDGCATVGSKSVSANKTYIIDLVVDAENQLVSLYINGGLNDSASCPIVYKEHTFRLGVGCQTDTAGVYSATGTPMKVHALNMYNRALTAEEIDSNLNTYVERFGLTL